eukprot:TRINITY_DN60075_c0_g1_i1.p1 TRINITY_DN60075_c0_g1~~TRINITY_DN60075_c0_g1_i1.p1  ORF type:complete len:294 (+),score=26.82 TRINITY_DN60075_c0_g1_i1:99-980(+)
MMPMVTYLAIALDVIALIHAVRKRRIHMFVGYMAVAIAANLHWGTTCDANKMIAVNVFGFTCSLSGRAFLLYVLSLYVSGVFAHLANPGYWGFFALGGFLHILNIVPVLIREPAVLMPMHNCILDLDYTPSDIATGDTGGNVVFHTWVGAATAIAMEHADIANWGFVPRVLFPAAVGSAPAALLQALYGTVYKNLGYGRTVYAKKLWNWAAVLTTLAGFCVWGVFCLLDSRAPRRHRVYLPAGWLMLAIMMHHVVIHISEPPRWHGTHSIDLRIATICSLTAAVINFVVWIAR